MWSVCYGSFNPRRRRPPRRLDDSRYHSLDWYAAHLLAVSIGILVLSAADAFLTLTLLFNGADEMNPVMAPVILRGAAMFTAVKMGLTSLGVVIMVFLARYRFMRVIRVDLVMYGVLLVYIWLVLYEMWMLKSSIVLPRLVISSTAVTFHIVPPSAKLECLDRLRLAAYLLDVLEVFRLNPALMSQSLADQFATTALSGGNAAFIEELYEEFLRDPSSLGSEVARLLQRIPGQRAARSPHGPIRERLLSRLNSPARAQPSGSAHPMAPAPNRVRCRG